MTSLDRGHRRALETAVRKARRAAEEGARQALEHLAVAHHEPRSHLSPDQRSLRNRLRARARQLGDKRDSRGTQGIERLVEQCAYEHWHRILFARFLAENGLLIEPSSDIQISLDDCRELATQQGKPWVELASEYAVRMLPQVFRLDDAVLELTLPAERRAEVESLLEALPPEVFAANDSLGWTYQFWQADAKDAVNAREVKIGARELAPVTQLFTEDYMVDFLLHNTLGAWWAGKLGPIDADTEAAARARAGLAARDGLPAIEWQYLRFVTDGNGTWLPAAGSFDGWPAMVREITVLDPCMGSGHFLVFALPLLARMRMEAEQLSAADAIDHTLHENLFGLELDERCTQIAAFNLALSAWRFGGYRQLPQLNIACSGLPISATEEEWVALAGGDATRRAEMKALYGAFIRAPLLGSLIDPSAIARNTWADLRGGRFQPGLFDPEASGLAELLDAAVDQSTRNEALHELAVAASGVARAATILSRTFTLVATNVPYLGRGKQSEALKEYSDRHHGKAKADLATCFVERCLTFCGEGGTTALVTPQNWLSLGSFKNLRRHLLTTVSWNCVVRLGARAFDTIGGEVVNTVLVQLTLSPPGDGLETASLDVTGARAAAEKAAAIVDEAVLMLPQEAQLNNPDSIVTTTALGGVELLERYGPGLQGIASGDNARFRRFYWELPTLDDRWQPLQSTPDRTDFFRGREEVIDWHGGTGEMARSDSARIQGMAGWGKRGIAVNRAGGLNVTLYTGEIFDDATNVIPIDSDDVLPAAWCYCSSPEYQANVRRLNQKVVVSNSSLVKVPFDLERWRSVAKEKFPHGLPAPESHDPTQWLFDGAVGPSQVPLQVAVARLVGYRWPRQRGMSFPGCSAVDEDSIGRYEDDDGIVPLPALLREHPASARIRNLLAAAFDESWNGSRERAILRSNDGAFADLSDWLDGGFFAQHVEVFQNAPFVWHIWDGRTDGFGALVNYHMLVSPNSEGRRTLEKLTHTYLGDWIARQQAAVTAGGEGADARLAAAVHLQNELLNILEGEPPYDIFVRWKPLHEQPIGWEPDINDGVRVNIRPFMIARPLNARGRNASILRVPPKIRWDKDRGKEPERPREDYPWFWGWDGHAEDFDGGRTFDGIRWNDLHYTRERKERARREHARRTQSTRAPARRSR